MREFLQKQKIGSPTFFLMHKIRGCGAWNDCFILMFCAMSNSKQEVLTQPQRIELELALRALLVSNCLDLEVYIKVLTAVGFVNTGSHVEWEGLYGQLVSLGLEESELEFFKSLSHAY